MLLEHEEPYTIIKSNQVSVLQHDPYSWEVMGPNFVPMQSITADSQFVNQTIKAWIASMDTQERNRLVDALFGLLGTGGIDKALDIFHPREHPYLYQDLGQRPGDAPNPLRRIPESDGSGEADPDAAGGRKDAPGGKIKEILRLKIRSGQKARGGFCYALPMETRGSAVQTVHFAKSSQK